MQYNGAGATLITSGFLTSNTTPFFTNFSATHSNTPSLNNKLNCCPLSLGSLGVIISNTFPPPLPSTNPSNNHSNHPVMTTPFLLNAPTPPASPTTPSAAFTPAKSPPDGFPNIHPPAPSAATNSLPISNLAAFPTPYHPSNLFPFHPPPAPPQFRSCTKHPAIAPGPAFRYL